MSGNYLSYGFLVVMTWVGYIVFLLVSEKSDCGTPGRDNYLFFFFFFPMIYLYYVVYIIHLRFIHPILSVLLALFLLPLHLLCVLVILTRLGCFIGQLSYRYLSFFASIFYWQESFVLILYFHSVCSLTSLIRYVLMKLFALGTRH